MSVFDEQGREINLLSLWADRKVVCAFTRHMGCRFCKEQTHMLEKVQVQLNSKDVVSMIITIGSSSDIPKFRSETGFTGEIYVDSQLDSPLCYNMLNLKHGREVFYKDGGDTIHAGSLLARERAKDFSDGGYGTATSPYNGDITQIGGIFVLGPGNTCDYSFRCNFVGHVVDLVDVVEAATGVSATGEEVMFAATSEWNQKLQNNVKIAVTPTMKETASETTTKTTNNKPKKNPVPSAEVTNSAGPSLWQLLVLALCACVLVCAAGVMIGLDPELCRRMFYTAAVLSVALCVSVPSCTVAFPSRVSASGAAAACPSGSESGSGNKGCPFMSTQGTETETGAGEVALHTIKNIDQLILQHGTSCAGNSFMSAINMDTFAVAARRGRTFSLIDEDEQEEQKELKEEDVEDIASSSLASLEPLEATQAYVREFLAKPNPHLGRKGPTCPFVPTSLKFDCLYLGVVSHAQASSVDSLEEVVLTMLQRFKTLEPREHAVETGGKPNPKVPYKAVILICPDVALADAPVWIDRLQRKLQPLFVAENALMLGEFHKNNNSSGLHNESFFPLRTPFPCLAMRNMVPSDIVFLNCPDYPLQTRIAMIQRYLDTFCVAGKKDGKDVLKAQEMIQKLQRENENVGV